MPRSSRSKSHKQSKHSSKEAATASTTRDYSGSDEDVKMKEKSSNGGKEDGVSFRISKDSSVSGERRKHGKDLFSSHGNGDVSEEYTTSSKRREEKSHGGSDRWNGGSSDEKGVVVNIENKELSSKSKDFSKVLGESKSKSSRRHDAESASVVVLEKDEGKSGSGNRGEKRKSEKESAKKESKENKESKDKERGSDRGRKSHPDKLEVEASSKQVENQSSKRGKESTEWPIEEGLRNPELEKELEKRMRRRGEASSDKDKYQDDMKEGDDRRASVKRHKDEGHGEDGVRQKDEKHREDGDRDRKNRDVKHRGESERHSKHRDDKEKEKEKDKHREDKYKDDKYIETGEKEERSRDGKRKQDDEREYRNHKEDKDKHRDVKHRDDADRDRDRDREKRSRDSKYKDSHSSKDHSIEPEAKRMKDDHHHVYDNDRVGRYKDDKDRRRGSSNNNEKEQQRSESEKRSGTKVDSGSERVRPGYPRDHHRASKLEENKHYEDRDRDRPRHNRDFTSEKLSSRSMEKVKDDRLDRDKSPSSRRSIEEEPGQRSGGGGSKDAKEQQHNMNNDYSQVDGDNLSVSSPYTRSSSHFRTGSDSPYFGSTEDDRNNNSNNNNNNKSNNNRYRRIGGGGGGGCGESNNNMNRGGQGNWKNVPSWPSPMPPGGGYIPFQHVAQPLFHPMIQQFPPPIFGRPPMKLNPGLPYHVPDHGRPLAWRDESVPPPLHGWDGSNAVFGDESHLYGWDRRNQMGGNRGWVDPSGEMWKGQNSNNNNNNAMDVQQQQLQPGSQKPSDEVFVENEQNQLDVIQTSASQTCNALVPEAEKVTESIQTFEEAVKEDDSITAIVSQVYLSRVDVSQDLTQPEVYEECAIMMDLHQEQLSDEFDCKILFLEDEGVLEGNVGDGNLVFAATNDSVFQKAMLLYKKHKEEFDSVKMTSAACDEEDDDGGKAVMEEVDKEKVVDFAAVKQEQEEETTEVIMEEKEKEKGCKVEEEEDESGGDSMVLSSDVGKGESVEFGSKVNLNRIHDYNHSPEKSTH